MGKWATDISLMGRGSALNADVVPPRLQNRGNNQKSPGWVRNHLEKFDLLNYRPTLSKLPPSRMKLWGKYSVTVWLTKRTCTVDTQTTLLWTGGEEIFSTPSKPFTWESPSLKESLRLPGRLIPRGVGRQRSHIHQLFKNKEDNDR